MSDLIRREDVVSRVSDLLMLELQGKRLPTWNEVYRAINDIPSAEPERTAKVVGVEKPIIGDAEGNTIRVPSCGNCENVVSIFDNFCPNCGNRLIWGDDHE